METLALCMYCNKSICGRLRKFCDKTCRYHNTLFNNNYQNTQRSIKKCYTCNTEFLGSIRTLYCSAECKIPKRERLRMESSQLKDELIAMLGGKCNYCERIYERTVMCFHHVDGNTKRFTLDQSQLQKHTRDEILEEVGKCILLCHNCHGIHHEKERIINKSRDKYELQKSINKRNKKRLLMDLLGGKCVSCGFYSPEYQQIMSFDHLRDKKFAINSLSMYGKTDDELIEEVLKCELLCMNCHISKNDKNDRQKSLNGQIEY